jgi:hypothetical protein
VVAAQGRLWANYPLVSDTLPFFALTRTGRARYRFIIFSGGPAPGYYGYGATTYFGAPGCAAPAYAVAPAYAAAPGYVAQPGYVEARRRVATTHPRNLYMSVPGSRHKRLETGQSLPKQPRQAQ